MTIMKRSVLLVGIFFVSILGAYAQTKPAKSKVSQDLLNLMPGAVQPAPNVSSISKDNTLFLKDANGNYLVNIIAKNGILARRSLFFFSIVQAIFKVDLFRVC